MNNQNMKMTVYLSMIQQLSMKLERIVAFISILKASEHYFKVQGYKQYSKNCTHILGILALK